MTTLITDGFEDETPSGNVYPYESDLCMKILYGSDGFSDDLSDQTLDTLLRIGAIELVRIESLPAFSVYLYRSLDGTVPA